jgi:hypothetical protein
MTTELNPNAAVAAPQKNGKRKRALLIVAAVVVVALVAWLLWYLLVARWHQDTDDAYVQGNVVSVTAQTAGTVVSIGADDGMKVATGQVLVQLDPNDARVTYEQAVANLANTVREVRGLYSAVDSGQADIAARQVAVQKPGCLSAQVAVGERHPSVGIVSSYCLRGREVHNQGLPYPAECVSGREVCRLHLLDDVFLFGTPTQVLYRAEVVRARRPFFSEQALHEDTEACYEILLDWDFGFVHQVLSFWRWRSESVSGRVAGFNPNPLDHYIMVMKYGAQFLSGEELRACRRAAEQTFYSSLAIATTRGAGRAFWAYHRDGLQRSGLRLSRLKLLQYLALQACELAFNPLNTTARLLRRRSRHRG